MRVLWFTNTPSLYQQSNNAYNGGGWIESLERLIRNNTAINLAVSFFHLDSVFKVEKENVTYYPIYNKNNFFKKLFYLIDIRKKDRKNIKTFLQVIDDFKPDIIHIFGSENSFGLVARYTTVPVVLHMQGITYAYAYAYYPPGYGNWELLSSVHFNPFRFLVYSKSYYSFCQSARREKEIYSYISN
jgi:hypothetical protein